MGNGLPFAALKYVVRHFPDRQKTRVQQIVMPRSTLQRREGEGRLRPAESERLERIARMATLAEQVWESAEEAQRFLTTPHPHAGQSGAPRSRCHRSGYSPGRNPVVEAGAQPAGLKRANRFRLAKRRYPVFDGTGAALEGARWNSPGRVLIYASEHYATAFSRNWSMRARTRCPGRITLRQSTIPTTSDRDVDPAAVSGWDSRIRPLPGRMAISGMRVVGVLCWWFLRIPGQPVERNFVINPAHPDAARIRVGPSFDVVWDGRLFGPPATRPQPMRNPLSSLSAPPSLYLVAP